MEIGTKDALEQMKRLKDVLSGTEKRHLLRNAV